MKRLPPLSAIRAFEAAARHENYSRAAEELAMTQAAVSYQMKLLEERLGAALFCRRGRGVALTDLGRRIAPQVTGAFDQLARAFATAQAENEAVLGIAASRTLATNWLAGRLGGFQLRHPDLAVRLDVSDILVDLATTDLDLGIRGQAVPTPGLVSHFLMRMPITPMASPAFLAAHPVREPADLLRVPRLSPQDDWWDRWFASLDEERANEPSQSGVRFESQVLDGQAAIAGHGIAILSPPMFRAAIAAGQLVQPLPIYARYRNAFWLEFPPHKRHLLKVRAFRDWLLAEVREAAADDPELLTPPS